MPISPQLNSVELVEYFTNNYLKEEFASTFRPLWDTMHLTVRSNAFLAPLPSLRLFGAAVVSVQCTDHRALCERCGADKRTGCL